EEDHRRAWKLQARERVAGERRDDQIQAEMERREEQAVRDPLRKEARVRPDLDVVLPLEDRRDDRRWPVEDLALRLERSRDRQDERREREDREDQREREEHDAT